MALVSMRQILDQAGRGGYGVGAFNVVNLEQLQAVLQAARNTQSPVILQLSRGARAYTNDTFVRYLVVAAVELYPEIPIAVHQDHGNSPETCRSAIELGFTSVMMDGSLEEDGKTPADFEYNVRVTREVVEMAHAKGVTVEGELGCLGGIEDGHGADVDALAHLTDPDQAAEFVERTGVDALAVAIGTSHGAYKFTREPDGDVLRIDLVEEIHRRLPDTHLVMHGSSSVPKELVDTINQFGGDIATTWGVPVEEIQRGIQHGVRKINVDTDCRLALTGAVRRFFHEHPKDFDPRSFLKAGRAAMQQVVEDRMKAFGQADGAAGFEPISLDQMAERYCGQHA